MATVVVVVVVVGTDLVTISTEVLLHHRMEVLGEVVPTALLITTLLVPLMAVRDIIVETTEAPLQEEVVDTTAVTKTLTFWHKFFL